MRQAWARLAWARQSWARLAIARAARAVALALATLPATLPARAETVSAYDVRVEHAGRDTRLVFILNACVGHQAYVLDQPPRAIVDLPEVRFLIDPGHGDPGGAPHRKRRHATSAQADALSYRFGRLSAGKSRIIVDLPGPADVAVSCANKAGASELTLAITPTDAQGFRVGARAGAERQARESREKEARGDQTAAIAPQPADSEKPLLMLDPGHGGVDSGTIGPDGIEEKNVVLDFAKALAGPLRASGRYRIAFTREDDAFVPLQERVRIAEKAGAALFVSLHADALSRASQEVHGATVYTVSERASDAEAERVAESENKADARAGAQAQEQAGEVNDILFDLTKRETRAYSNIFAKYLSERWKVAATLNKNPRRFAGFVVLKAPDVPSILLELGYLSSARDAADLTSPQWRDKAAAQVAKAIDDYFAERRQAAPGGGPAVAATPQSP